MLYTSYAFVIFFVAVLGLYLALSKSFRSQNWLLLAASYFFYGYWDWRFLTLIAATTLVDFTVGRKLGITAESRARRRWLLVSLVFDLGVLGFFKYFNFFAESFAGFLNLFGMHADALTLKIILPIGISFYTFQSLSYTIDVYKKRLEPVTFLPDYALFVSMFPQLLSGPIARAKDMLPQIARPRAIKAEQVSTALFLILWGYCKKVLVADNLATTANTIFDHYTHYQGVDLILGVLAFALQIYGDFSGYSDIARGVGKLLGFELMLNFRLPYFSIGPSDFWTRWNISLSTWLRDYIFWPLMGTRIWKIIGKHALEAHTYRNIIIVMLLGGLWHGASWNFVLWGGYYGVLIALFRIIEGDGEQHAKPWSRRHASLVMPARMILMFVLSGLGWLLFRSHSVDQITWFLTHAGLSFSAETTGFIKQLILFGMPVFVMEAVMYVKQDLLFPVKLRPVYQGVLYGVIMVWMCIYAVRESLEFIYFRF